MTLLPFLLLRGARAAPSMQVCCVLPADFSYPTLLHATRLPFSLVARRPAPLRRSASGPGASLGLRWVLPGEQLPGAHLHCCLTWLPGSSSLPSVLQRAVSCQH